MEQVPAPPSKRTQILLAFASVYFFWGSTYLAIKIAGEQLPAPLVSAARATVSAVLIAAIAMARGKSLWVPKTERAKLALVGILFMSANNVLLTWGEKMVPAGFASLVVCTTPIMIALLEVCLPGGDPLNARGWLGTALGTVGILVLVWPSVRGGVAQAGYSRPLLGVGVLLLAALAFAIGAVLSRRFNFQADSFVATGWQLAAAALCNWTIALGGGNLRHATWTPSGIGAILYLATFGSLIGLVAFTFLLQNVPVGMVSTYAFVNPVVAVLLGVTLLQEQLFRSELVGMAIIVCAVATVVLSRSAKAKKEVVGTAGEAVE